MVVGVLRSLLGIAGGEVVIPAHLLIFGVIMDSRQLPYLAALAREKHFTRAAQACHVTEPTLSGRIANSNRSSAYRS